MVPQTLPVYKKSASSQKMKWIGKGKWCQEAVGKKKVLHLKR